MQVRRARCAHAMIIALQLLLFLAAPLEYSGIIAAWEKESNWHYCIYTISHPVGRLKRALFAQLLCCLRLILSLFCFLLYLHMKKCSLMKVALNIFALKLTKSVYLPLEFFVVLLLRGQYLLFTKTKEQLRFNENWTHLWWGNENAETVSWNDVWQNLYSKWVALLRFLIVQSSKDHKQTSVFFMTILVNYVYSVWRQLLVWFYDGFWL